MKWLTTYGMLLASPSLARTPEWKQPAPPAHLHSLYQAASVRMDTNSVSALLSTTQSLIWLRNSRMPPWATGSGPSSQAAPASPSAPAADPPAAAPFASALLEPPAPLLPPAAAASSLLLPPAPLLPPAAAASSPCCCSASLSAPSFCWPFFLDALLACATGVQRNGRGRHRKLSPSQYAKPKHAQLQTHAWCR